MGKPKVNCPTNADPGEEVTITGTLDGGCAGATVTVKRGTTEIPTTDWNCEPSTGEYSFKFRVPECNAENTIWVDVEQDGLKGTCNFNINCP